jgi:hypothetical protein
LAKERLTEWLAAGKVPWTCMSWKGLDAKGLAKLKREALREREGLGPLGLWRPNLSAVFLPSAAYYPGDPQFWNADSLKIDWDDDGAYESSRLLSNGAQALGIKVSRAHLQAILPEDSRQDETDRHGAACWVAAEARCMKKAGEIPQGVRITVFARELARRMQKAATIDRSVRPIKAKSIENKLREWGLWPVTSIK